MNYQRIYDSIVLYALKRNISKGSDIIVESHHIVPKHCGGSNRKDNLVNLTLREHYVCHVLLARIYKNTPYYAGMCRAVVAMNQRGGTKSRVYETIRGTHIKNLRNQIISEEQKNAISKANKGNKARLGMKNTEQWRQKFSAATTGKLKHDAESRARMSEARKGTTVSQNHRDKISQQLKGRKKSLEHIENMKKAWILRKEKLQEKKNVI